MKDEDFIGLGNQYLHLVEVVIVEMKTQGNPSFIITDYNAELTDEQSWEKFEEITKWSDFNLGVPLLFNFYHGIELVMKGLIAKNDVNLKPKTHLLSYLFGKLNTINGVTPDLKKIIEKYISVKEQNPFSKFFTSNNTTPDKYYTFLKYPIENSRSISFANIRGNDELGIERFTSIYDDIKTIKK